MMDKLELIGAEFRGIANIVLKLRNKSTNGNMEVEVGSEEFIAVMEEALDKEMQEENDFLNDMFKLLGSDN